MSAPRYADLYFGRSDSRKANEDREAPSFEIR